MSFSAEVTFKSVGDRHTGEWVVYGLEGNPGSNYTLDKIQEYVHDMFETGVWGPNWYKHDWKVVVSGHHNENHEPASGWANDFLSIQISQLT